jgi:hypothetical protein
VRHGSYSAYVLLQKCTNVIIIVPVVQLNNSGSMYGLVFAHEAVWQSHPGVCRKHLVLVTIDKQNARNLIAFLMSIMVCGTKFT